MQAYTHPLLLVHIDPLKHLFRCHNLLLPSSLVSCSRVLFTYTTCAGPVLSVGALSIKPLDQSVFETPSFSDFQGSNCSIGENRSLSLRQNEKVPSIEVGTMVLLTQQLLFPIEMNGNRLLFSGLITHSVTIWVRISVRSSVAI
jgi:hypothetical protein